MTNQLREIKTGALCYFCPSSQAVSKVRFDATENYHFACKECTGRAVQQSWDVADLNEPPGPPYRWIEPEQVTEAERKDWELERTEGIWG
jgi:hypothetical protein